MGHNMEKILKAITDKKALDNVLANSKKHPVVVFKHSNSCPISALAYREMQQLENDVAMVDVQSARDVSKELAEMTGIRHESPQVIVFVDGRAVWSASHYAVKARDVEKALETRA